MIPALPSMFAPTYGIKAARPSDVHGYLLTIPTYTEVVARHSYRPVREQQVITSFASGVEVVIDDKIAYYKEELVDGRRRTYHKITAHVAAFGSAGVTQINLAMQELREAGYEYMDEGPVLANATAYRAAIGAGEVNPGSYGNYVTGRTYTFKAGEPEYQGKYDDHTAPPTDGNHYTKKDGKWSQVSFTEYVTANSVTSQINSAIGSTFNSRSVLLSSNTAIAADGALPSADPFGKPGWYYKNAAGAKINWYFYAGSNKDTDTLVNFNGWYAVIEIRVTGSYPFLAVYTAPNPTGGGNGATWYRTRRTYVDVPVLQALTPGRYLIHTAGLNVTNIHTGLPRVSLPYITTGPNGNDEKLSLMALNTSSGRAAGADEFLVEEMGIFIANSPQTFQMVALPQQPPQYTEYFKGSFATTASFPASGKKDQWVIDEQFDKIYVWDQQGGGWKNTGTNPAPTSTATDTPFAFSYSAAEDNGFGYANASGSWLLDANSHLIPTGSNFTSDNRVMFARLTDPGDTVVMENITDSTDNMLEFAMMAWFPTTAPTFKTGVNWGSVSASGWTSNSGTTTGNRQLTLLGGTSGRWQMGGYGETWTVFTSDQLLHSTHPIHREVKFRLSEARKLQLFISGILMAESTGTAPTVTGVELWLLAPTGREYPQPTGGLTAAPTGIPGASTPSTSYWMSTVNPGAGAQQVLASGGGYFLYRAATKVNTNDVGLSSEEAEAAKGCRVFHNFTGKSLHERTAIMLPVIEMDDKVLTHVRDDATSYFASLGLTFSQQQEKYSFYKNALDGVIAGSVQMTLTSLQALTVPAPATGGHVYNPGYVSDSAFWDASQENLATNNQLRTTYGMSIIEINTQQMTFHFDTSTQRASFQASTPQLTISNAGIYNATINLAAMSKTNGTNFVSYTITGFNQSGFANAIASTTALRPTLTFGQTGNAPVQDLSEQEVVTHLIEVLQEHLKKFPR